MKKTIAVLNLIVFVFCLVDVYGADKKKKKRQKKTIRKAAMVSAASRNAPARADQNLYPIHIA